MIRVFAERYEREFGLGIRSGGRALDRILAKLLASAGEMDERPSCPHAGSPESLHSSGFALSMTPIKKQGSVPRTLQPWLVPRMTRQSPGVHSISSTSVIR